MRTRMSCLAAVTALSVGSAALAQRHGHGHTTTTTTTGTTGTAGLTDAQINAQARDEYNAGTAAFNATHYDEALAHFTRAHELRANPIVLIPIANSQERLGRYGDAVATLQQY